MARQPRLVVAECTPTGTPPDSPSLLDLLASTLRHWPDPDRAPQLASWRTGQPVGDSADVLVIDDPVGCPAALDLLPTRHEHSWAIVRLRGLAGPPASLWGVLSDHFQDRHLMVLADAAGLCRPDTELRFGSSWERAARDLVLLMSDFPYLNYCAHLIASIGDTGALAFTRHEDGLLWKRHLFYGVRALPDPRNAAAAPWLVAALALHLLRGRDPHDVASAIAGGLAAARKPATTGLGALSRELVDTISAADPAVHRREHASVGLPAWWEPGELHDSWTILQARYRDDPAARDLALRIIEEGAETALWDVPLLSLGELRTADPVEIDALTALGAGLRSYVHEPGDRRPFCIGVFGSPGSGKSFGVRSIAEALAGEPTGVALPRLEFNLTQMRGADDLAGAFERIESRKAPGTVPLVFWDEFDRVRDGRDMGWLESFLAPAWDASFDAFGRTWSFGKVIFVFAGGTSPSYRAFAEAVEALPASTKARDFRGRLRAHLDVPPIAHPGVHRLSNFVLIRRALLIRSLLERMAPRLLQGPERRIRIDHGVAWALLAVTSFRSGARGLEHILASSALAGKTSFGRSDLPADTILAQHAGAEEFRRLLYERPDALADEIFPSFDGWPLRPDDPRYRAYAQRNRGG